MQTFHFDKFTTRQLCLFGSILSLVLSMASILQNKVLHYDSLLYLETATTYLDSGLDAAIDVYPWPFLSILIATLHQVTGLSLLATGHLLITLLYMAITCTFIILVRDLGGTTRAQLIAAILILIFPTFNDYRAYIIRDPGYWFCILLSLQQLVLLTRQHSNKSAFGWAISVSLATAFRSEGIFIAVFAPLALLLTKNSTIQERFKQTALSYGLLCVICIGLIAGLSITTATSADKYRLYIELINLPQFFGQLIDNLSITIDQLSIAVANRYTADDMRAIYLSGLLGLLAFATIHSLTLPFLGLMIWQHKQYRAIFTHFHQAPIAVYLVTIIFYLCLFTFKQQFVSDRFFLTFAFILLLPLPFILESLLFEPRTERFTWGRILVCLLLIYQLLDSIISTGASKAYIAAATHWLNNDEMVNGQIISNQEHIGYFAGGSLSQSFKHNTLALVEANQLKAVDIVALQVRHKQMDRLARIQKLQQDGTLIPLKTFANKKQDQVLIFKLNHNSDHSH